jgi:hypothetical protein
MDVAERIGLLPGFGWIAGHNFWLTLLLCLLLTPIVHCLIGLVFETRWVPLTPRKQFLSFFPGDVFLGMMTAGLLVLAHRLPSDEAWYNAAKWHTVVLSTAIVLACVMTWLEHQQGDYSRRAMWSPTKLYHNFILYGGYGYIIATTLVAVVAAGRSWWLALALLPGLIWLGCLVGENFASEETKQSRVNNAHVEHWYPFWQH